MSPSREVPLAMPDGWFAVAWSKDLVEGEVKRARYFGEDLVLFRTRSGEAKVLDAYCAHLGAHLGEGGKVVGESIQCPFHGWRYDGNGVCVDIPYCKKIPPKARVRGWDVEERNRMIHVWRHAEGKPPSWDLPTIPELEHPEWTEPRTFELQVAVHMQDMAENNCDPVHFQFVHGSTEPLPTEISFAEDGRYCRVSSKTKKETEAGTFEMELERDTWGLGLATVRLKGLPGVGLLMYSSTAPIDVGHSHSRWLFTTTKNMADDAGEQFVQSLTQGVMQDMRIWENKTYRAHPVLCEADRYLAQFRRWTRQFYSQTD